MSTREHSRAYRSYGTSERPHLNGNSIYRWNDKCAAGLSTHSNGYSEYSQRGTCGSIYRWNDEC